MPQLKSGRHMGLAPIPLAERIKFGGEAGVYVL